MDKSKFDLELVLDRLLKLHSALDRIGIEIFPDPYCFEFIDVFLNEILFLHDQIDEYVFANPSLQVLELVNETIVKALKTIDTGDRPEGYAEFNEFVKSKVIEKTKLSKHDTNIVFSPDNLSASKLINGHRDGPMVEWHKDEAGSIGIIGRYSKDIPDGTWFYFSIGGQLSYKDDRSINNNKKHDELVNAYKSNISIFRPTASNAEGPLEVGMGAVLVGSLATLFLSNIFLKKNNKKISQKNDMQESAIQIENEVQAYIK